GGGGGWREVDFQRRPVSRRGGARSPPASADRRPRRPTRGRAQRGRREDLRARGGPSAAGRRPARPRGVARDAGGRLTVQYAHPDREHLHHRGDVMAVAVRWAQGLTRPILIISGPPELAPPVLPALHQPPTIQYDRSFDEGVLEPTTLALREVFQTKGEVILMPGSGRTALEAGALSVIEPGDRVLVIGAGQFGVLMREIMNRVGAELSEFSVELGQPLDLARLSSEAERLRPKAITLVHNETSTGTTYPAAEVGKIARRVAAL